MSSKDNKEKEIGYDDVYHLTVLKEKRSDFMEAFNKNTVLNDCAIMRILPSGNYYIFSFETTSTEQRDEFDRIQDEWI